MLHEFRATAAGEPTLEQKVAFLRQSGAYAHAPAAVTDRETHMSWVFLAGDKVYKLKKPVRFPYLDFSTLALREAACRAELRLNRRLAADVYLGVASLNAAPRGLSIGGEGKVVDWLVVMRRLDESQTLEHAIGNDRVQTWQLDRLAATLVNFYRCATPVMLRPEIHLNDWHAGLAYNRRVLLDPRLGLPAGLVRRIDGVQRRFLARHADVLARRVRRRCIVDGHGDLRPEHIFLGDPVRIIDCLEFNPRLRAVDPFDEIAFLSLECERLGAPGPAITSGAASPAACATVCRRNCFCSTAATAQPCARVSPSPTCSSPTRARRKNGRGLPAAICAWRRRMPPASSVPNPKFALPPGTLDSEFRIRKDTSKL